MLDHQKRDIDGETVTVVQFAGQRNFDVLLDLARLVGPAIGAATDGKKEGESILDQDIDLGAVADALFGAFNKGDVKDLVTRLLSSTYVNDKVITEQFDDFFAGPKIWRLPKVLMFVLEVNFGNFSDLGANITSLSGAAGAGKGQTRDG